MPYLFVDFSFFADSFSNSPFFVGCVVICGAAVFEICKLQLLNIFLETVFNTDSGFFRAFLYLILKWYNKHTTLSLIMHFPSAAIDLMMHG